MAASPAPRTPKGTPGGRKVSTPFTHASPSSSSSLKLGPASSSSASSSSSTAIKASLLSRHDESTYHRKLRSLLQDHARTRSTWVQLVSFEGIRAARALAMAWEDVDNARATPLPLSESIEGGQSTDEASASASYARDHATALALHAAEAARGDLDVALSKIQTQAARLTVYLDQARALLLEAAKARGVDFVSETPLWGTWTMDRFVQALGEATTPYVLCTAHLAHLAQVLALYARTLTEDEETSSAPTSPKRATHIVSASSLFDSSEPTPSSSSSLSPSRRPDGDSGGGLNADEPERRRAIQAHNAAIQAWARLPHLDEAPSHFLDEVCEVEVGRWTER